MKGNPVKKENMWNAILNEQSNLKRHANKNLLLLGRKNAGKRSLIDSLTDISKTQYPKKSMVLLLNTRQLGYHGWQNES